MMRLWRNKTKGNPDVPDQDLYSTEGATGMKILSDPSNADLDIVFVHGLTGNRDKTWTHKNGTFWPRDLLANDLPNARLMTYGYDADVFRLSTITSSNRLCDHGQDLSYSLVSQRTDCSSRPILFIAHCLGGLVCQQALVLSSDKDGLWQIPSSCIGIIFMGTPHFGSGLAAYGEKLARWMNMVHSTNREVVGTLYPSSNDLQLLGNEFQSMLRGDFSSLKIFCFYEAIKMNDLLGKIVEEHSAVLRGYENCSINADHSNMTKFSGKADGNYDLVRSIIVRWLQEPDSGSSANKSFDAESKERSTPPWLRGLDGDSPEDRSFEKSWAVGTSNYFNGTVNANNSMQGYRANGDLNITFN